jgi:hypothetical protein
MDWLFMQSLKGHATPKAYLDAQFTYDRPEGASRVLASARVGRGAYYAAVEHRPPVGVPEVWGLICLVRYNPRDKEGYIFGYKDLCESMGPSEIDCPARVLDLLTPTANAYALAWRAECRVRLEAQRALNRRSAPKPGQTVVFADPILFRDGRSFSITAISLWWRRCARSVDVARVGICEHESTLAGGATLWLE